MSELIENNNVIDARPLFKVRRDSRVSTLDELETILEAEELCEEVCMSITDDIVHVVQEFGFDLSNKKLVDDIFLGNLTFYKKLNDRSSWATSLKYYSLGNIQFNEFVGGSIIDQGQERPSELSLDLSYALKLSEKFSMAIATRYIRSDLKISLDADTSSANTLGIDIAGFYQTSPFDFGNNNAVFSNKVYNSTSMYFDISNMKKLDQTILKYGFATINNYV